MNMRKWKEPSSLSRSSSNEADTAHHFAKKLKEEKYNDSFKSKYRRNTSSSVQQKIQKNLRRVKSQKNESERNIDKVEQPNFEPSGLLMQESNLKNGVALKYVEPQDSSRPRDFWRLYAFKKDISNYFKEYCLYPQSHYVIGKDSRIVDIVLLHSSISKQHAVIQFRERKPVPVPYIIDLESTNGSQLNNKKIESRRFYELKHKDCLVFAGSTREFILIHESEVEDINDSV